MAKKKKVEEVVVEEIKVKEEKKKNKNVFSTTSLIMGLIGIVLLFLPEEFNKLIGYIIGGAFLLVGIITVVKYYREQIKPSSISLVSGILYAILGLIIVLNPLSIMKLATIIFGIYLIVNGALKVSTGYAFKGDNDNVWKRSLISGTIIIIFGLVLIINPFSGLIITKVAGAFILTVAIYDIIQQYI